MLGQAYGSAAMEERLAVSWNSCSTSAPRSTPAVHQHVHARSRFHLL